MKTNLIKFFRVALLLLPICFTHAQVPLLKKPVTFKDFYEEKIKRTKNKNYVSGIFSDPIFLTIDEMNQPWDRVSFYEADVNFFLELLEQLIDFKILRPQNLSADRTSFISEHTLTKKDYILAIENLLLINGMGIIGHNHQYLKLVPIGDLNVDDLSKNSTKATPRINLLPTNEKQTLVKDFLTPFPQVPEWSNFNYNSPEERAYWDKLPDWSEQFKKDDNFFNMRNRIGKFRHRDRLRFWDHYAKIGDYSTRIILECFRGYIVRSKSLFYNGQNKEQCNYKMGELHGLWMRWYHNGQKKEEGHYKEGKKEGLWKEWWFNGQKKEEGHYKEGRKEALWKSWNRLGKEV